MTTKYYAFVHPDVDSIEVVNVHGMVAPDILCGEPIADLNGTTNFIGKWDEVIVMLEQLEEESATNTGPQCYYTYEGHGLNMAGIMRFKDEWQQAMQKQKAGEPWIFRSW